MKWPIDTEDSECIVQAQNNTVWLQSWTSKVLLFSNLVDAGL